MDDIPLPDSKPAEGGRGEGTCSPQHSLAVPGVDLCNIELPSENGVSSEIETCVPISSVNNEIPLPDETELANRTSSSVVSDNTDANADDVSLVNGEGEKVVEEMDRPEHVVSPSHQQKHTKEEKLGVVVVAAEPDEFATISSPVLPSGDIPLPPGCEQFEEIPIDNAANGNATTAPPLPSNSSEKNFSIADDKFQPPLPSVDIPLPPPADNITAAQPSIDVNKEINLPDETYSSSFDLMPPPLPPPDEINKDMSFSSPSNPPLPSPDVSSVLPSNPPLPQLADTHLPPFAYPPMNDNHQYPPLPNQNNIMQPFPGYSPYFNSVHNQYMHASVPPPTMYDPRYLQQSPVAPPIGGSYQPAGMYPSRPVPVHNYPPFSANYSNAIPPSSQHLQEQQHLQRLQNEIPSQSVIPGYRELNEVATVVVPTTSVSQLVTNEEKKDPIATAEVKGTDNVLQDTKSEQDEDTKDSKDKSENVNEDVNR